MNIADLDARLDCVARSWTPGQRLHVGNVAWAYAHGDGSAPSDTALTWGDPLWGFADIWLPTSVTEPATADLHLGPVTAHQVAAVVDDILQLWRSLIDLSDLPACPVPTGIHIRGVRRDELAERVEVHRRCWDPARIRQMIGLPVTGDERGSGYSMDRHLTVIGTPPYREELDLVVEAADGSLVAYGLGWLDARSGSVLFEPVGTVPDHAGRGLARALCVAILRAARDLGATQAVVGPRGDAAHPVPRTLYEGLRMREIGQVVSFTNGDPPGGGSFILDRGDVVESDDGEHRGE